jgi:hypothetical protein
VPLAKPAPAAKPVRLRLFADYHQFYLQDEQAIGDLSEAWTVQATEDRMALAPGVFGVGTLSLDTVRVTVLVLAGAPPADLSAWDHVTECSVKAPSGRLVIAGCTDYFPDARRIEVPAGSLRARVSHRLADNEHYRVQLWPAPVTAPVILKRWAPAAAGAAPAVALKPPRTRKRATEQARLGNTDLALEALLRFGDRGDAAASASAAELLAFRGEWTAMVPHAMALLGQPDAVYAGNLFTDMCLLVRRAATELGDPEITARASAVVPPVMNDRMQACLIEGRPLQHRPAADAAELESYRDAVRESSSTRRFEGKPDALARHTFALASVYNAHDEMVRLWPGTAHVLDFDHAADTARILVERGEPDAAWAIIESMVARWWPVDDAQVAPVILVADPALASLMTPERCARVLATPRGAEAQG